MRRACHPLTFMRRKRSLRASWLTGRIDEKYISSSIEIEQIAYPWMDQSYYTIDAYSIWTQRLALVLSKLGIETMPSLLKTNASLWVQIE